MREPAFWYRPPSLLTAALWPLSKIYGEIAGARMARNGIDAGVPVICVGNFHMGGAGKTPTVLALLDLLQGADETPVVLSRGYGGRLKGPMLVDPSRHGAQDVGDEPLMMAAHHPVVIARDRVEGAVLCRARGANVIVMDDGLQNPSLVKHLAMAVLDASRGIGNGRIFPSGPLRAPLDLQLARTDAIMVIGEGDAATRVVAESAKPVFRARLVPNENSLALLRGKAVLAFAGIGDPDKFFRTLRGADLDVAATRRFADHHVYAKQEIAALRTEAQAKSLTLVTTEKDRARLGTAGEGIAALKVALRFDDEAAVRAFVVQRIEQTRLQRRMGRA